MADTSWLVTKTAADDSHGRFVRDAKTRSLAWDDDGVMATANHQRVVFENKVTLTLDSFVLL